MPGSYNTVKIPLTYCRENNENIFAIKHFTIKMLIIYFGCNQMTELQNPKGFSPSNYIKLRKYHPGGAGTRADAGAGAGGGLSAGKLEDNEGLASFITIPLPQIQWTREGMGCAGCRKAIAFLRDLGVEVLPLFYTINMTCYEDRMKERLSIRCRLCLTFYHWYFAQELHRSLDGAAVHVDRVRVRDSGLIKRG